MASNETEPNESTTDNYDNDSTDNAAVDIASGTTINKNGIAITNGSAKKRPADQPRQQGLKIDSDASLVFNDVSVSLNNKEILKNVYGFAKVDQILAIMGPSGAGKTTLLNTITGRIQTKAGSVTLNGTPVDRRLRRKIAYVMQQDVFYAELTLRETLTFQASLRLPNSMPNNLKAARVMELADALNLRKCLDTPMGNAFMVGLSGGEKKRASIACEMLINPKLLVLDEPTSGLDSALACNLISCMENYTRLSHKTVVATIHQPSSQVFYMFSNVLLLNDGQVAYFGPTSKIVEFFSSVGLHCTPHFNPADFILEQLKVGAENAQKLVQAANELRNQYDWPTDLKSRAATNGYTNPIFFTEDEGKSFSTKNGGSKHELLQLAGGEKATLQEVDVEFYIDPEAVWQSGFWTQYVTLTKRSWLHQKDRYLSVVNFLRALFFSVYIGFVWIRIERNEESARDRLGLIFFATIYLTITAAMDSVHALIDHTGVFFRERAAGLYRLSAYFMAAMTTEIPVSFVLSSMYIVIYYFMVNLMPAPGNFFAHWAISLLTTFTSQSFAMLLSVVILPMPLLMTFLPTFIIATFVAVGFYNSHIASWLNWARYLSYLSYAINALAEVEFTYGSPFGCNPNATLFPDVCTADHPMIDGWLFLEYWKVNFTSIKSAVPVLVCLTILSRVVTYLVLRFARKPRGVVLK